MRYNLFLLCASGLLCSSSVYAQTSGNITYTIRSGDTLTSLGQAILGGRRSLREIARINRIRDVDLIYTHAPLRIPRRLLRDVKIPAKVETFSGHVNVREQLNEREIRLGDLLGEGATIITGRNSFVTMRLSDGSTLALPSQSTVKITRLRRVLLVGTIERDFQLLQGRTKAHVVPMPDTSSTFHVRTPVSHAAVRGTMFRSAYDQATGVALTEVDEGSVIVGATNAPSKKRLMLHSNFGSAIGSSMRVGAIKLLDPPAMRNAGQIQTEEELHFSISPVANAERYRVEIARDAALLDPIAEELATNLDFTFASQPAGIYFARVAAVDELGLEGASRTYSFERRQHRVTGALQQRGRGRKRHYFFRWEAYADGEPAFRFQLQKIGDATPIVDELGLRDHMVSITNLPPGSYAWRVFSTLVVEGKAIEARMPEQTFEVVRHR